MKFCRWTHTIICSLACLAFAEPQAVSVSAEDFELPPDVDSTQVAKFEPIEAESTIQAAADSSDNDIPSQAFVPITTESTQIASLASENSASIGADNLLQKSIPEELNRPLRVGVFVGVKELYLKFNGEEIKVTAAGSNIKLQSGKHTMQMESREFQNEDGSCIAVAPDPKTLKTACYPGTLLIRANGGKLDAINAVDVEEYLRGSVPYEIGKLDESRIEALKAQAIAARTYAYKHFNSREAMGFDVYADVKDQVYKGLEGATPLTDAAVKATEGIVMTYGGEFIIAYYHSTCGGHTETLATWNRPNLPYLKSAPDLRPDGTPWCSESSYMNWERTFTDKEIAGLFKKNLNESKAKFENNKGEDFKKIKDITIVDHLEGGRILTLRVKTDKGNFEVLTDKTRWLFKKGGNILPSSAFSVKHQGNEWIVTGTGFGHGVGMCQMGVRARAQAGQSFQEILTHYYPGITLEHYNR